MGCAVLCFVIMHWVERLPHSLSGLKGGHAGVAGPKGP